MPARLAVIALFGLATATACGGGGGKASETKVFDEEGFGITFEYPGNFDKVEDLSFASQSGASAKDDSAVGLDGDNLIIVSKFELNISVTRANVMEAKPVVDRTLGQIAGRQLSGKPVTVGGLPGFEYTFPISRPEDGKSRISILFDRKTEYELNCQSTPEKRTEIERACARALDTLRRKEPQS
jgi:hypothetical protein